MSEESKVLLVDAGNTNIKMCLVDGVGNLAVLGHTQEVTLDLLKHNGISSVLLCSVRHDSFASTIKDLCKEAHIFFKQLKTVRESFGIICAYENYKTMGVDRWMGVLAGAVHTEETVLSISIGTAMTVDLVHRGQHVGGWITPGFDLSKQALFKDTENVFGNNTYPKNNSFATSTEECVNHGCRAIINGLILEAIKQTEVYSRCPKIIVFGGGADLVNKEDFKNLIIDHLWLFKGMKRYI